MLPLSTPSNQSIKLDKRGQENGTSVVIRARVYIKIPFVFIYFFTACRPWRHAFVPYLSYFYGGVPTQMKKLNIYQTRLDRLEWEKDDRWNFLTCRHAFLNAPLVHYCFISDASTCSAITTKLQHQPSFISSRRSADSVSLTLEKCHDYFVSLHNFYLYYSLLWIN